MLAFNKFGQKYASKTQSYLFLTIAFTLIGWIGVLLISVMKGPGVLYELRFATNLMLQGSAAIVFFMYVQRIFDAYREQMIFSPETLTLIKNLAQLMMLFALVIEPGCYFIIEFLSDDPAISDEVSIATYGAYINIALFAAGYALHLISSAHKVARHLEQEQNLTI